MTLEVEFIELIYYKKVAVKILDEFPAFVLEVVTVERVTNSTFTHEILIYIRETWLLVYSALLVEYFVVLGFHVTST